MDFSQILQGVFPQGGGLGFFIIIIIIFGIAFFGAFIGGITGLGGGMLIKPMLGSMLGMAANTLSLYISKFISTGVVFSMSAKSASIYRKSGFEYSIYIFKFLAIGLVVGILSVNIIPTPSGALEILLQGILYFLVFLSVLLRNKYPRLQFKDKPLGIILVGFAIGFLSAFFGIGGGAIKVPFFLIFFSMTMKEAAIYSFLAAMVTEPVKLVQYGFHIYSEQAHIAVENAKVAALSPFTAVMIAVVFGIICIPAAILGAKYGVAIQQKASDEFVAKMFNIVIVYFAIISFLSGVLWMSGVVDGPISIFGLLSNN